MVIFERENCFKRGEVKLIGACVSKVQAGSYRVSRA